MERKRIAIIGASYLQLPLIEKAKEMGLETHVFAWAADDVGEKAADYFYPISIVEKDLILEKCKEIGICGICSIASDLAMLTVNYVANAMGLTANSMETTLKSTNKHLMRKAFEANGDPSPRSYLVDESTDLNTLLLEYPIIVKPTDRSGSRGIYKLENSEGLEEAAKAAADQGFEKKVLVEEFAEGQEYSIEYVSWNGKHFFLAATLKFTTGAPHFIETGHREPAPLDSATLNRIKEIVPHALDSLGIQNGASHSELKIADDGTIRLIEIGGRMGGDCIGSDLVYYSTGYDFVKMVIQIACGQEPEFVKVGSPRVVESRFIFTHEDMDKYEMIKTEAPDKILKTVYMQPDLIGGITDSSNRAGCYIVDVTEE